MDEQGSALETAMRPEEIAMVEDVDRYLEEQIEEMQKREITVKRIAMGRKLYFLFVRYGTVKKISATAELSGKDVLNVMIFPELFKRANLKIALAERQILFERVGSKRYPIRIDFNSDSPISVKLIC